MTENRSLTDLFFTFFKIGLFTIGGGLAMIPFIQAEFTDKKRWISNQEMVDIIALAQSLPGIISINSAIFIGLRVRGLLGGIVATLAIILPSFICIIALLTLLMNIEHNQYVKMIFTGIKAASSALILSAVVKLGQSTLKNKFTWITALASFLLITIVNINAAWGILIGAIAGLAYYRNIDKIKQ